MAFLGDLLVRLKMESADFQQNLSRAATQSEKAFSTIQRSANKLNGALGLVTGGLGAVGLALFIKQGIDAADHLNDLSKSTGISVEQLSGLKLLAKQTGGELDGMAASINKMSKEMGKTPEKFAAAGISAKDPLEAFKELADLYVAIKDPQERAAVAEAALGKSWMSAASALAEGGQRIQEIIDKGAALSGMTKEAAERADKFNDTWAEFSIHADAAKTGISQALLPAMTDIARAMSEAARDGGALLAVWVGLGGAMAHLTGIAGNKSLAQFEDDLSKTNKAIEQNIVLRDRALFGAGASFEREITKLRTKASGLESEIKRQTPVVKPKVSAMEADDAAEQALVRARKLLNFEKEQSAAEAAKKKAIAEAISRDKLYANTLQGLEKQYFSLTEAGQKALVMYETEKGSLSGLTEKQKENVIAMAARVDVHKEMLDAVKAHGEISEAEIKHIESIGTVLREQHLAYKDVLSDMEFELSLIGLTVEQKGRMNAARQIELDMRRSIAALPEFNENDPDSVAKNAAAIEQIQKRAAAQTEAVLGGMAKRREAERDWATGAKDAMNEYVDHATNAAERTKDLFSRSFKAMEDALVDFVKTGKLDFKSLANTIISEIIRIQVQQSMTAAMGGSGGGGGFLGLLLKGVGMLSGGGTNEISASDASMIDSANESMYGNAGGMPYVPRDMATYVHKGEAIIPAAENLGGGRSGGDTYMIDARGADASKIMQLEQMIVQLNGSVERRAVSAVSESRRRGGSFSRSFG